MNRLTNLLTDGEIENVSGGLGVRFPIGIDPLKRPLDNIEIVIKTENILRGGDETPPEPRGPMPPYRPMPPRPPLPPMPDRRG